MSETRGLHGASYATPPHARQGRCVAVLSPTGHRGAARQVADRLRSALQSYDGVDARRLVVVELPPSPRERAGQAVFQRLVNARDTAGHVVAVGDTPTSDLTPAAASAVMASDKVVVVAPRSSQGRRRARAILDHVVALAADAGSDEPDLVVSYVTVAAREQSPPGRERDDTLQPYWHVGDLDEGIPTASALLATLGVRVVDAAPEPSETPPGGGVRTPYADDADRPEAVIAWAAAAVAAWCACAAVVVARRRRGVGGFRR